MKVRMKIVAPCEMCNQLHIALFSLVKENATIDAVLSYHEKAGHYIVLAVSDHDMELPLQIVWSQYPIPDNDWIEDDLLAIAFDVLARIQAAVNVGAYAVVKDEMK